MYYTVIKVIHTLKIYTVGTNLLFWHRLSRGTCAWTLGPCWDTQYSWPVAKSTYACLLLQWLGWSRNSQESKELRRRSQVFRFWECCEHGTEYSNDEPDGTQDKCFALTMTRAFKSLTLREKRKGSHSVAFDVPLNEGRRYNNNNFNHSTACMGRKPFH